MLHTVYHIYIIIYIIYIIFCIYSVVKYENNYSVTEKQCFILYRYFQKNIHVIAEAMATVLPAIKQAASKPFGSPQHSMNMPAVQVDKATKKSKQAGPAAVVVRPVLNKKERELQQRMLAARAKLPELTEWQTDG